MITPVVDLDPSAAGRVPERGIARLLGHPRGRAPSPEARSLIENARRWCAAHARPWARTRALEVLAAEGGTVRWRARDGRPPGGSHGAFRSADLARRLREARADGLVAVGVSAGAEVDAEVRRLHGVGAFVEATCLDRYGAALAEWLAAEVGRALADVARADGRRVLPPRGPGREDWDLAEQVSLLAALALDAADAEPVDVELTDGGMLRPAASLLTVLGVAPPGPEGDAREAGGCPTCTWSPCAFRR